MATTIAFRPGPAELDVLARAAAHGMSASAAIGRGLALLDHEMWWQGTRDDLERLAGEDLTKEPDAW